MFTQDPNRKALWHLFLGAVCIAFAPILIKAASSVGPTTIGFYRCAIGGLVLLSFSLKSWVPTRQSLYHRFSGRFWLFALGAAVMFALDLYIWNRSILYCGAGLATILAGTQVFYLALIGIVLLKERLTWRFLVSVPTAFLGIYLLVNLQTANGSDLYYWGVVLGLGTGMTYAAFVVLLRLLNDVQPSVPTVPKLALVSLIAALFLIYFAYMGGENEVARGWDWVWLCLLGIGPQAIGWVLILENLPRVPISKAGLILLTQPVLATLMGAEIYGEHLSWIQITGALLTLFAIYLGITRHYKRVATSERVE